VALGAPVTIVSGLNLPHNVNDSLPSVVTDGVFLPEGTDFHSALGMASSIEWGAGYTTDPDVASGLVLDIDLGGEFTIAGAIVQADNNDAYMLQYWDSTSGSWQLLYSVPEVCRYGFTTRPNGDQATYAPVGPVVTDLLQFSAIAGDGGDAVSEIEVEGTPAGPAAPEPSSLLLFDAGLVGNGGSDVPEDRLARLIAATPTKSEFPWPRPRRLGPGVDGRVTRRD
jgi:hypothetical protein